MPDSTSSSTTSGGDRGPAAPASSPTGAVWLFRATAVATMLVVAMGAVVCATRSGAACLTWPGCFPDQLVPRWELNPVIEFAHRVVAMSTGLLVLACALLSGRLPGRDRWLRILPPVALLCAVASALFGRRVVLSTLPTWLAAVDVTCALVAMTVTAMAAVRAGGYSAGTPRVAGSAGRRRTGRLAAGTVVSVMALHVTGILAAAKGSYTACIGWPMWRLVDADPRPWFQEARLGLAAVSALLVIGTAVTAARAGMRVFGGTLVGLFAAEMLLGVVIRSEGISNGVASVYSVLAVELLWCLGLLTATAFRSAGAPGEATAADRSVDVTDAARSATRG